MKIFIVCSSLTFGGAERVAAVLANGFAKEHDEVYLISNLNEKITYQLDDNVKLLNLVNDSKCKLLKWISSVFILRKYIKQYKPNAIVGIMELCSFVSKVASAFTHIPVVATVHNSFERPLNDKMSKWEIFQKFYLNKLYKCVTVLTDADQKFIGNRLKNTVVMPNPLCLPINSSFSKKEKIVLAAGRIDAWYYKGFDVLLTAWAKVAKKYPDWKLQIAGQWRHEESKRLLDKIAVETNSLNSIEYLGFQSNMQSIYERASIFVLSSRYEGFGLVLIEAMSQGCACIACDYKGRQAEILEDGKSGLLCPVDSVVDLEKAIETVIENNELRSSLQHLAIKRVAYYSVDNSIKRWKKLLQNLIL